MTRWQGRQLLAEASLLRISSIRSRYIDNGKVGSWMANTFTTTKPSWDLTRATLKKRVLPRLKHKTSYSETTLTVYLGYLQNVCTSDLVRLRAADHLQETSQGIRYAKKGGDSQLENESILMFHYKIFYFNLVFFPFVPILSLYHFLHPGPDVRCDNFNFLNKIFQEVLTINLEQ